MPAYTFRGAGTVVVSTSGANLSPTVTHSVGDLLILHTAQRAGAETVAAITGWTKLGSFNTNGSIEVWARIADGGANDAPTVDWSGTTFCDAWIEAFYGDIETDLGSIIVASNTHGSSGSANLVVPSLTVPSNDCLIVASCRKSKTATSNDNTWAAPASFTERQEYVYTGGTGSSHASCSWQQTTATNVSQANWTLTGTSESLAACGLIFALKTLAVGTTRKLKVMVDAGAQSDGSIAGAVFQAPTGGNITGAKIGEFTGKTFEAALESGYAVLKVPVADFGGEALTTSDTPVVLVRNTVDTSGILSATVIDE